jgi:hypothetical protein
MIGILYQESDSVEAEIIEEDIQQVYEGHLQTLLVSASEVRKPPAAEPSWDDLLIVLFSADDFPEEMKEFISSYLGLRHLKCILPVNLDPNHRVPPAPISGIKAVPYDSGLRGESSRIAKRVGTMLGLRLRHQDNKIFISYRASDGTSIAKQVFDFFKENGFEVWLDEAKDEYDGEGKIPGGADVQEVIEQNLLQADLVLLIDTPKTRESNWIRLEINHANANLIPILPVCFREMKDHRRGPRLLSLKALQRWVEIVEYRDANDYIMNNDNLDKVLGELEAYLCDIFRRKLRIPEVARRQFLLHGFNWSSIDPTKHLYGSMKQLGNRLKRVIVSKCSIFDEVYTPALKFFVEHCFTLSPNYSLFIYDGEVLSDNEIQQICDQEKVRDCQNLIVLHHQEISILLASDFQRVSSC